MNNHFFSVPGELAAVIVNPKDPYSGYCYGGATLGSGGTLPVVNCARHVSERATTYGAANLPGDRGRQRFRALPAASLSGSRKPQFGPAAAYMVAENGSNAEITPGLVPNFYGWSLHRSIPSERQVAIEPRRPPRHVQLRRRKPAGSAGRAEAVRRRVPSGGTRSTSTTARTPRPASSSRTRAPGKLCPAGSISDVPGKPDEPELHLQHLAAASRRNVHRPIRTT